MPLLPDIVIQREVGISQRAATILTTDTTTKSGMKAARYMITSLCSGIQVSGGVIGCRESENITRRLGEVQN